MTKRSYVEAVLDGIKSVNSVDVDVSCKVDVDASERSHTVHDLCNGVGKKIYVRLLLSIDRRETTAAAIETVS